jgi:hypothetical protein
MKLPKLKSDLKISVTLDKDAQKEPEITFNSEVICVDEYAMKLALVSSVLNSAEEITMRDAYAFTIIDDEIKH